MESVLPTVRLEVVSGMSRDSSLQDDEASPTRQKLGGFKLPKPRPRGERPERRAHSEYEKRLMVIGAIIIK